MQTITNSIEAELATVSGVECAVSTRKENEA
jgi:hypothetical protein